MEREMVSGAADRLAASGVTDAGPYLIGVRHHAPALAAMVPALLDAARPAVLLVELPAEFQPWLAWLADESTVAPVALAAAGAGPEAEGVSFYPFADFSPELAALRWAARHGVEAHTCDLPLARRGPDTGAASLPVAASAAGAAGSPVAAPAAPARRVADALRRRLTGRPDEDLWDRLVEAAAPGCPPEAVRRAALLVGWALREDAERGAGGVDPYDLRREAWMRSRIAAAATDGRRVAAVIGAFHAPALLAGPPADPASDDESSGSGAPLTTSLIPYTYPLLDARSGYPSGIRDPEWQHQVLEAAGDPEALELALTRTAVRICAALRSQDHPAGPADAREIVRLAADLARLRDLPAPGRGELVEAVQTVLAQGEPVGRGRAVARALEEVLVGSRTGRPAPGAPRSGLAPAVEAELAELGLPGPADSAEPAPRDLRLDPHRRSAASGPEKSAASATQKSAASATQKSAASGSEKVPQGLDLRRELLLRRLDVCGVPYGERVTVTGAGGTEALTTRWRVRWTPAVAAMLTVAGLRGVTPAQAAEGTLRERLHKERRADGPTARQVIDGLDAAASCGLPALADTRLAQLTEVLPACATLPELLDALTLVDRLGAGHLAGLEPAPDRGLAAAEATELLTAAAVRRLEGLGGSDDPADARALLDLARRADALGGSRLGRAMAGLAADGTPLIRGAAGAVRVLLGQQPAAEFGVRVASWVDGATGPDARHGLGRSLTGLLSAAEGLLNAAPEALEPLLGRVATLADPDFLDRLPALRSGFDTLSPAARDRLLTLVEERLGERVDVLPEELAPATLAAWTRADLVVRQIMDRRGLLPATATATATATVTATTTAVTAPDEEPSVQPSVPGGPTLLPPGDRWRLVLGRPGSRPLAGRAGRLATALDELYGTGQGEGSGPDLTSAAPRGGRQAPFPGVREWSEELTALFGPGIREEVLAAAVAHGRTDALESITPDVVRPSVDLLRTVLAHAGGLPEARLARLRPLVGRLIAELTRELATKLRPALTGLTLPRPSRRPGGPLDLHRTIRANLATARPDPATGRTLVVPERPVFRSKARKAADWRLILVVDVSGSMETSTIWAALTASILAGVPALSTHFLAFSTEVIDLTDQVDDPLGLLLEVRVGGGTHIAAGLRHARSLVTVPSRTLVAVVSDFEEGYPLGGLLAETRALVEAGCHLLGCAALDDTGRARYSTAVAGQLVAAGMPVAALSPLELARWVGEKVR